MISKIIEICESEIKKQANFNLNYQIKIFKVSKEQISFEPFYSAEVLDWCKRCGKGKICGRCPSEINNYNEKNRKKLKEFDQGLLLMIKVPSQELAGLEALKENRPAKTQKLVGDSLRIIKKKLQENGFEEFYLLGNGPCKLAYCSDKPCTLLQGKPCRHPKKALDILECSGVNVFKTIENVGDKIYYIDKYTDPKNVPYGSRVGLILYKK